MFADDLDLSRALLASFADRIAPAQKVASFAANGEHIDVLVLEIFQELHRRLQHIGVERACQPAVARHQYQQDIVLRTNGQQRIHGSPVFV